MYRIFIAIIGFIFLLLPLKAQQNHQDVIDSLNSANLHSRYHALIQIEDDSLYELLPIIEQNIWSESDIENRFFYFRMMHKFGSPYTQTTGHRLIDSMSTYSLTRPHFDTLYLKFKIASVLFKINDYSAAGYIFELLHRDSSKVDPLVTATLKEVHQHVPAYVDSVRNELKLIARNSTWKDARLDAQNLLVDIFGAETIDELVYLCSNENYFINRLYAIGNLIRLNYSNIRELLVERLYQDPDLFIRSNIAESLLVHYGSPADYNSVLTYLSNEYDANNYHLIVYKLTTFRPPQPDSGTPIHTMLDTLINLKHQVAGYNWLGNQEFIDELDDDLDSAKMYIQQGDSVNCRRLIKIFQHKVDEEYRDSLDGDTREVKLGGWQFLYWNAEYILATLPPGSIHFWLTVKINGVGDVAISPNYTLYDSATTVTLTILQQYGHPFTTWSGDVPEGDEIHTVITIVMDRDKDLMATFSNIIYTIHVDTSDTNGTIFPSGEVTTFFKDKREFDIMPKEGFQIDSVFVDNVYVGSPSTYLFDKITTNHTIVVKFKNAP